jgi:hypothetical protein
MTLRGGDFVKHSSRNRFQLAIQISVFTNHFAAFGRPASNFYLDRFERQICSAASRALARSVHKGIDWFLQ